MAFFPPLICIDFICQQTKKTGLATAGMATCGGLNSSSGGKLKLYLGCTGSTSLPEVETVFPFRRADPLGNHSLSEFRQCGSVDLWTLRATKLFFLSHPEY